MRGVAKLGGVLPRRRGVYALPRAISPPHRQSRHALYGNLQRLGGLLRLAGRPRRSRHALDDRLRRVLRVRTLGRRGYARGTGSAALGGRDGAQLRHGDYHHGRTVALHDWRHGALHADRPLQVCHHGTHQEFYQRLRRGTDCGQRRARFAGCLRRHGGAGEGLHRRAGLHERPRQLPPPVAHRVRPPAAKP